MKAAKVIVCDSFEYDDIVLISRDADGRYYLGHSFYYGGRDSNYLLFLYKDELPLKKDGDLLSAWNDLDDNSFRTVIVSETDNQIAVEDFLYSHGHNRDWKSIAYRSVENYSEIDEDFAKEELNPGEVIGYAILKDR